MKRYAFLSIMLGLLGACDDEVVVGAPSNNAVTPAVQQPVQPGAPPAATAGTTPAGAEGEEETTTALSYTDEEFVELDIRNRDPFRRFLSVVRAADAPAVQRRVIMPQTAIDEMRLIAIVGGGARPRAMLQDSSGVGFVVKKDDYIGREEVLQPGGADGMPVTLNWQVARIRGSRSERVRTPSGVSVRVVPGDIVLTRTDPTAPDRPPLTRVIPMYEDEDPSQRNLAVQ